MFARSTVLIALFSLAARVVVATPPACLLAAVNTCDDPSDMQAVCKNATKVESYLASNCGGNAQIALNDFQSVCSSAGVTVPTSLSTSSSSSGTASSGLSSSASETGSSSTSFHGGRIPISATATSAIANGASTILSSDGALATSASTTGSTAASSAGSAASTTSTPATGVAARLCMDLVSLAAVGAFGAMLAL